MGDSGVVVAVDGWEPREVTPEEFWLINRVDREAPLGVNTVARYRYERWRSTRNLVARAILSL